MPISLEEALAAVQAAKGGTTKQQKTKEPIQPQGVDQLFSQERIAASGGQTGNDYGWQPQSNVQPITPEFTVAAMPNSDRLTPMEHWLYGKLPGFTESTVGKALERFGESWVGKLLNVLDIGAEGLERTIGLGVQYSQVVGTDKEQEFWDHIKEAWNAGTMTYETTNLPTFKRDETGKITGIEIPADLPGASELTLARQKLISGMPIEQVRDEYFNGLGALQLRAQLYDTYGHIVLDPLNVIGGALKPVEKAHVLRNVTVATKFTDEAVDVMRGTIKAAEEAGDIGKLAEAARVATKTSDIANLQKIADLEKAGDISGLAKLAGDMTEANKITRWEKAVVAITGGDPFKYTAKDMERQWWNPFALTPASRAHEYLTMVTDNVGSYIISKFDDPEQVVEAISRATKTATGSEFGHAFLTMEGRVTQGALAGFDIKAQELIGAWRNTTEARTMLQNVAQMALGGIDDAALDTVVNAIAKGGGELDAIAKLAGVTSDDLLAIGKSLEGVPYHSSLFKAALMNELYEHTGKMAVNLFGVKSRGLIEKMSLAMKSAESLAFLRTNPAFLARNFINNELTLMARGIFTRIGADETTELLNKIGYIPGVFEPGRLRQGFSMIGETSKASEAMAKGTGEIFKALRGEGGWLDNITNKISDIKLGKLDMGELAQRVEVSARSRATVYGYTECYRNMLWKPGKGYARVYDVISSTARQQLETAGMQDLVDAIEHKISTAWHEKDLEGILGSDNLRANIASVVSDATKKTGFDIEKSLPADFIPNIERGLEEAIPKGRTAVSEFINRTRLQLQQRLNDLNEIEISRIASETEAALKVEGPNVIPKLASKYVDEFWEAHIAHAVRMEDLSIVGDKAMQNAAWKSLRLEDENYFTRVYGRLEAALKGVKKGAKGSGIDIPDSVLEDFKAWRGQTKNFFKISAKEWNDFFDGKSTKKYGEIADMLDSMYAQYIADEDKFLRNIDIAISNMIPDGQTKQMFIKTRNVIANARRLDKEGVAQFFKEIRGLSPAAREAKYKTFWQDRQARWINLQGLEKKSSAAMAGDAEEVQWADSLLEREQWQGAMEQQATEAGEEVAPLAKEAIEQVATPATKAQTVNQNYMPDASSMGIYSAPIGTMEDQYYIHRGFQSLDAIERAAIETSEKAPLRASNLPEDVYNELAKYVQLVKGNMADARYTAMRYSEWKADTALLNYNRRYNFDTWLGAIMPFEFWFTHSAFEWAVNSIDRPAMLTTYLRMRKSLETMGAPNQKIPDRLKGSIRINLPFAPKWMGEFFVDPIKATLPFDQFMYPLEKWRTNQYTLEGQAERLLQSKIQNKEGDVSDLQNALDTHQGQTWQLALAETEANNEDLKFDAWDFVSLMSSPHAPLVWAKEYLDGTPENIGPFMPLTRMSRGVSTMLGMEDFALFPHNIEAKVRKSIGLPAYDRWDYYRTMRMAANMAATGEYSVPELKRAMATQEGAIYDAIVDKMNKEFAVGAMGSILGIPIKAYPIGEQQQRALNAELSKAYKAYDGGDVEALNKFFDKYPEYEVRLMQYKKDPDAMMRDFLAGEIWDKYQNLAYVNRTELKDQLGAEFETAFLNKETRSYDSIDINTMAVWLKLMGGDPPGTLKSTTTQKLELTPSDIAYRVDTFKQTRDQYFPDWYNIQSGFYKLKEGSKARKEYLKKYPMLTQYWGWRRDFMMRNPDTLPYLTDMTKEGEADKWQYNTMAEMEAAYGNQPNFTWNEWRTGLGENLSNLVLDHFVDGRPLSEAAQNRLEKAAANLGITYQELLNRIETSLR